MVRHYFITGFSLSTLLLSGCTLTPSHFDGYDLLDTGYVAEHQDPVGVPVKEASDAPRVKASPKPVVPPPALAKPVELKKPDMTPPVWAKPNGVKPQPKPDPMPPKPLEKTMEKAPVKPPAPPKPKSVPCDKDAHGVTPPPPPGVTGPQKTETPKREVLRSGDRLKITVFREKDLSSDYQVNDKGMISFPMIGETKAAGLTPDHVKQNLVTSLSKGYLVHPDINVEWLSDCNLK